MGARSIAPLRLLAGALPGLQIEETSPVTPGDNPQVVGLRLTTRQRQLSTADPLQVSRGVLSTEIESVGELLRRMWSVPPLEAERRRALAAKRAEPG